MDYAKHYSALVLRARVRIIVGSSESHHVIPRCMGGSDGAKNRINLTPEEHYVAHQLLIKIFPNVTGLLLAAVMMSRDNRNGKRSNNKLYGWLRRRAAEATSIRQKGKPRSQETRDKISAILKVSPIVAARAEARRGIPRDSDVKSKLSIAHKTSEAAKAARDRMHENQRGVPQSPEHIAKCAASRKGRVVSDETSAKISAALTGKPKSLEHVAKVAAALKGRPGTRLGAVLSEDTKSKMRAAAIGRVMSPEAIAKMVNNKTPEQRRAAALKAWQTKRSEAQL